MFRHKHIIGNQLAQNSDPRQQAGNDNFGRFVAPVRQTKSMYMVMFCKMFCLFCNTRIIGTQLAHNSDPRQQAGNDSKQAQNTYVYIQCVGSNTIYTYIYIYVYRYISLYIFINIYIYICRYIYIYIYIHIWPVRHIGSYRTGAAVQSALHVIAISTHCLICLENVGRLCGNLS